MVHAIPEGLQRGCWLEIDVQALYDNMRSAIDAAGQAGVIAVVKANAYGHGDVPAALTFLRAGAAGLAVSGVDEGVDLRAKGIHAPILILGGIPEGLEGEAARQSFTQTLYRPDQAQRLETAAKAQGLLAQANLKLDTGMGRIGIRTRDELTIMLDTLANCPHVQITGAFTHFALSDVPAQPDYTLMQLRRFEDLTALLPRDIPLHASNTAAIYAFPQARFSYVRAGLSLYGYDPTGTHMIPVRPAMTWKVLVTHLKEIEQGEAVSYGCIFHASRKTRVATVCCGYADGYHRAITGKGFALVNGQRAPIIGRICMDQMMLDVTDIPGVQAGQAVTLLGQDGAESMTADDLANWAGTISYEILCAPNARVKRLYRLPDGRCISEAEFLQQSGEAQT